MERSEPLYKHFADMITHEVTALPRLTVNLFTGGQHAGMQVSIQEMMLVPISARTTSAALAQAYDIYQSGARLIQDKYAMRSLVADEGGLAPPIPDSERMFADAIRSISDAAITPGKDVGLIADIAASHLLTGSTYTLDGHALEATKMIEQIAGWMYDYPILRFEDGLAEDWHSWARLNATIGQRALVSVMIYSAVIPSA